MSDATETEERTGDQPALKRVMGPGLLLLFIVGDVLGTGIYALTGQVAAEVGGVVWLPFLVAFLVALVTAFSYLELVTKYPQAAGAALYTHKAFGVHFLTFLVAFAVMSSGITSASTAARAFSANFASAFELDLGDGIGITLIGLGFMSLVALVNHRGVGESVKANVVLTCVELSGLLIVIGVGVWALGGGDGDFSRVTEFETGERSVIGGVIAATGLVIAVPCWASAISSSLTPSDRAALMCEARHIPHPCFDCTAIETSSLTLRSSLARRMALLRSR